MQDTRPLLCLDMDRVLVDHLSTWQVVYDEIGADNSEAFEAYNQGLLDEWAWIKEDIGLIERTFLESGRGRPTVDALDAILERVPMMDGMEALISTCLAAGWHVAIVSGGVHVTAHRIAAKYPAQGPWKRRWGGLEARYANGHDSQLHVFTNGWLARLSEPEDGHLRPLGRYQVQMNGKGSIVRMLQRRLGVPKALTVAVGDSAGDIGMFQESGLAVCFNPWDERPASHVHHVLRSTDLHDVLALLRQEGRL